MGPAALRQSSPWILIHRTPWRSPNIANSAVSPVPRRLHAVECEKMHSKRYDAVVVGAGPNGLAAAVELARRGCSVLLLEAAETIGGGTRSAALTHSGFIHDVCSAIHP